MKIECSQKVIVKRPVTFEEIAGIANESRSVLVEMVTVLLHALVRAFVDSWLNKFGQKKIQIDK